MELLHTTKPHRPLPGSSSTTTTTTSKTTTAELFICFSSRLHHSSSMRLTNKSILSPARTDKPTITTTATPSLSASLSRRLKSNGSLKGGQSPMFPPGSAGGKKRGSGFDNPEPSSPKVTCIGQVRVKTKKQSRKMMMRNSRSRRHGGDMSFRRGDRGGFEGGLIHQNSQSMAPSCLPHRNQRWVHLPLTICEALRSFGSEINCFTPCKSSSHCITHHGARTEREVDRRRGNVDSSDGSCSGGVCRWFVSLNEGEGKSKDIEFVVGDEEVEEMNMRVVSSRRRSIFDGIEFKDERNESEEGDERRVSICIPPKNALLLMRCRSDPLRLAALSSKSWEPTIHPDDWEDNDEDEEEEEEEWRTRAERSESGDGLTKTEEEIEGMHQDSSLVEANVEDEVNSAPEEQHDDNDEVEEIEWAESSDSPLEKEDTGDEDVKIMRLIEAEIFSIGCPIHLIPQDQETKDDHDDGDGAIASNSIEYPQNQAPGDDIESSPQTIHQHHQEDHNPIEEVLESAPDQAMYCDASMENIGNKDNPPQEGEQTSQQATTQMKSEQCQPTKEAKLSSEKRRSQESETGTTAEEQQEEQEEEQEEEQQLIPIKHQQDQEKRETPMLPDCLLLMMCEPKLSMEVSKETWVCTTDFLRWLPDRHHRRKIKPTDPSSNQKKTKPILETTTTAVATNPPPQQQHPIQPPRSSCSFPIAQGISMAGLIGKGGGVGYGPLVLPRCKSEPVRSRTEGKFSAPDLACFWKSRRVEVHRPATVGVGR